MKELTSIGLAVALAVVIGVIGYAAVAPSGEAWSEDLAARQAAFREAEAQRRAEAEAEARRQAEAQAEAQRQAEAERQAAADTAATVGTAPAAGGGYNPLAPQGGSAPAAYDPLAGASGGGGAPSTAGYDPLAARPAAPSAGPATDVAMHPEFGMPDTEGVDTVYYSCTACHSAAVFTAQQLTPTRWDEVLTWMVETQNMAEPHPDDRAAILDYLVRHYSTESAS